MPTSPRASVVQLPMVELGKLIPSGATSKEEVEILFAMLQVQAYGGRAGGCPPKKVDSPHYALYYCLFSSGSSREEPSKCLLS